MTPYPLKEKIFLSIDKTLVDEISTDSGFKLYLAPEWNFEQNTTVAGNVSIVPKNFNKDIKPGDEVAFSYSVIANRTFPEHSDYFVLLSEGSPYIKIWQNHKGEKVRMIAHQGAISIFWTGTYFDKHGEFQYGKQGTEKEVERWLHTNFKFGNCENFIYKNLITVDNKDYWKCPYENIFAKKVNGEIVSIGNRVICEIIDIPVPKRLLKAKGIHIPDSSVQMRFYDRGKVISGGESIGVKKGDIVSFEERYCEKYKLWDRDYFLIKQHRVQGIWK
jgi:co-chaperonin GroES (HSP10)